MSMNVVRNHYPLSEDRSRVEDALALDESMRDHVGSVFDGERLAGVACVAGLRPEPADQRLRLRVGARGGDEGQLLWSHRLGAH